ncbi:hypothetical protein GCM10012287_22700 [Streptomyces daqingensis]|uniref:Uncharacterized protein n=1 Tax=Streptomyces daqingensis TaxID=1472640 RepID=A0ABQ2M8Q2_9ACTN|nr:hypothetical protein [Streptomyces daqingensis]GGO48221.1 hypothetical protein GCM10012287_22700 [Streptomyces daqingensis]
MKTTLITRNTANPRRTTLASLQDADELTTEAVAAEALDADFGELPAQTANPQRTVLEDAPVA